MDGTKAKPETGQGLPEGVQLWEIPEMDSRWNLMGPILATQHLLDTSGGGVEDIDVIQINQPFARGCWPGRRILEGAVGVATSWHTAMLSRTALR